MNLLRALGRAVMYRQEERGTIVCILGVIVFGMIISLSLLAYFRGGVTLLPGR